MKTWVQSLRQAYLHRQAHCRIQEAADGRLDETQQQALDAHLAGCASCRVYAEEIRALESQLRQVGRTMELVISPTKLAATSFSSRQRAAVAIQARYRKYQMKNRFFSFAGVLAAIGATIVVVILINKSLPTTSTLPVAGQPISTQALTTDTKSTLTQETLRFFIRAESDHLPPPSPRPTPYPTPTISAARLSLQNAEQQVGFNALEFIRPPIGLALKGARVVEKTIYTDYVSIDGGCTLTLAQTWNSGALTAATWEAFPADEGQAVNVGGFDSELVHDSSGAIPVVRLRWQQPDYWQSGLDSLELVQSCTPGSNGYLDDEALLRLASQIVESSWWDSAISITEAENQVGFKAYQLSGNVAEEYTFLGATVEPQYRLLTLVYLAPISEHVQKGVSIRQWPATESLETCDLCAMVGASAQVTTVALRGTTGEYVEGVWSNPGGGPNWEPIPNISRIRWQENGYWFELSVSTADGSHTMQEMVAIAESMK